MIFVAGIGLERQNQFDNVYVGLGIAGLLGIFLLTLAHELRYDVLFELHSLAERPTLVKLNLEREVKFRYMGYVSGIYLAIYFLNLLGVLSEAWWQAITIIVSVYLAIQADLRDREFLVNASEFERDAAEGEVKRNLGALR